MNKKGNKIIRLCSEIECLCEKNLVNDANNKILELLGVVTGSSRCSYDINKAVNMFIDQSEGYEMKRISTGAMQ